MKTEAQRSTTLFKILSTHCYVLAILFITCMLRKTELNHFFLKHKQTTVNCSLILLLLAIYSCGDGPPGTRRGHPLARDWAQGKGPGPLIGR